MEKTCGNCALNPYCEFKKFLTSCSNWARQLETCDRCGRPLLNHKGLVVENNIYCDVCQSTIGTCGGCLKFGDCAFESDPVEIPKVIVKQIRQGNAIINTQIKNPERVKATCSNCDCFHDEICSRETDNYCVNLRNFCDTVVNS